MSKVDIEHIIFKVIEVFKVVIVIRIIIIIISEGSRCAEMVPSILSNTASRQSPLLRPEPGANSTPPFWCGAL